MLCVPFCLYSTQLEKNLPREASVYRNLRKCKSSNLIFTNARLTRTLATVNRSHVRIRATKKTDSMRRQLGAGTWHLLWSPFKIWLWTWRYNVTTHFGCWSILKHMPLSWYAEFGRFRSNGASVRTKIHMNLPRYSWIDRVSLTSVTMCQECVYHIQTYTALMNLNSGWFSAGTIWTRTL